MSAVVATSFGPAGARALAWTRRAGESGWAAAGAVLPGGFGSSYDASATAVPGGPLLVVAGAAPPGEGCIQHGSVAIAAVGPSGRLGPVRLVGVAGDPAAQPEGERRRGALGGPAGPRSPTGGRRRAAALRVVLDE